MNIFQKRNMKKTVHLAQHLVRHALHMRGDVASSQDLQAAKAAQAGLTAAWAERDWDHLNTACDAAAAAAEQLMPSRNYPRWRENVEVLVVAIAMAMACRTYLIQPFKIPTGSMQPTLNGITAVPQEGKQLRDRFPINLANLAVFGERYVEVKARNSGRLEFIGQVEDQCAYRIGNTVYPVRLTMLPNMPLNPDFADPEQSMKVNFEPGDWVAEGEVIASGRVRQGDHIFVNKVLYHFTRPKRGQIIVFDTNFIPHLNHLKIRPDTFYIKRLVGLPGESVSIRDKYLLIDGNPITEPAVFARQATDPAYRGYVTRAGSLLNTVSASIPVGDGQFLPFGDNTTSSQDGRYFGPVSEDALVGPSFFVYWPFGQHWGLSR
jgi:signal peptidase I